MGSEEVVSPACGRVIEIARSQDDPGTTGAFTRVSIFLSVWDDHVTRSPIEGRVESVRYTPGRFGFAFFRKNLLKNENNLIWIAGERLRLAVRQISGRVARRIVCDCRTGDRALRGQRLGEILLGSCVQLYLPLEAQVNVRVGQKVKGAQTILAEVSYVT